MFETNRLTNLNPIETYQPPKIPTFADTASSADKSALLKRLPSRWARNAAVIACAGILSVTTLSGCADIVPPLNLPGPCPVRPLDSYCHCGGSGAMPMYVVRLTEQEVFGIIRSQLESAGLSFDEQMFDSERNVMVEHSHTWREPSLQIEFEECYCPDPDLIIGVFQTNQIEKWDTPTDEERAETLAGIEETLAVQAQEFIEYLREQGIL